MALKMITNHMKSPVSVAIRAWGLWLRSLCLYSASEDPYSFPHLLICLVHMDNFKITKSKQLYLIDALTEPFQELSLDRWFHRFDCGWIVYNLLFTKYIWLARHIIYWKILEEWTNPLKPSLPCASILGVVAPVLA